VNRSRIYEARVGPYDWQLPLYDLCVLVAQAYERALAIRPNLLDAQMFFANFLVDTGKVEQAVPLLERLLLGKPHASFANGIVLRVRARRIGKADEEAAHE
jgi:predicted Zn-dependent protease